MITRSVTRLLTRLSTFAEHTEAVEEFLKETWGATRKLAGRAGTGAGMPGGASCNCPGAMRSLSSKAMRVDTGSSLLTFKMIHPNFVGASVLCLSHSQI